MAWTGLPGTITYVADNICVITGLSLANGASDTISFSAGTGTVKMPSDCYAKAYTAPSAGTATPVGLVSSVIFQVNLVGVAAVAPAIQIVKTVGAPADVTTFLATFTNGGAAASGGLEIISRFRT